MWVQLSPPSVDFQTPLPIETFERIEVSPVPAHTTAWSLGATGERADGVHGLVVEHGPPVQAGVVRFPDPSGGGAGEVRVAVTGDARDRGDAVADGSDVARPQPLVLLGRELLRAQRHGGGERRGRD